jgi:hypothetical protein
LDSLPDRLCACTAGYAAEAAEKVDEILEKMENDVGPDDQVFTTAAINAKVNDSDPRSVEETATILRQLEA